MGPIGAHVIGFVDKDNIGIAGMEKYLDQQSLTDPHVAGFTVDPDSLKPVRLSLDLKATHALRDELEAGLEKYQAKAGAGAIIDVNTGEIIALESLPDYDPNDPPDMTKESNKDKINRDQCRRLRDGIDLQGDLHLDGAGIGQGKSRLAHRRARQLALRTLHYS